MTNAFVHVELNTDDVGKAKQFYKKIFKWKLEDMKMGPMTYTMVKPDKGTGGGMQNKPMPGPTMWLPYVEVESVKKTIVKARELGAQIMVDSMEVPGSGTMGVFTDPTGAPIGIWEPAKRAAARRPAAKKAAKKKTAKKK